MRRVVGECLNALLSRTRAKFKLVANAAALRAGNAALKLPATGLIEAGAILRHGWSFDAHPRESTEFVDRVAPGAPASRRRAAAAG